eukprot:11751220-Alexandrium_andersonii.AAC.1
MSGTCSKAALSHSGRYCCPSPRAECSSSSAARRGRGGWPSCAACRARFSCRVSRHSDGQPRSPH